MNASLSAKTSHYSTVATRESNERRFQFWEELPDGGRRYIGIRQGRVRGYARYIKTVDADENNLLFVQEIYDHEGRLIALHQKYPLDTGHKFLKEDES